MTISDTFTLAEKQLHDLPPNITLAILHPDFHSQHCLFAPFLSDSSITSVFVVIPEPNLSLSALLSHLKAAIEIQLNLSLPDLPEEPKAAAAALVAALKTSGEVTLIIDAYDLIDQNAPTQFIIELASQLPDGYRLLLSTREMPMSLIQNDLLYNKTALVPVNSDLLILDYTQMVDKTVLEVRAFGPGRVLINGNLIEHWDGKLPRMLFFYFIDRAMVTRDDIFNTFWPNLSIREATNVFHVTKRKISEILQADLTIYKDGFYRISPQLELAYDVVKFIKFVQLSAIAETNTALIQLQNAITLYNGPFLSTLDQIWINQRREEMASNYVEALTGLARIHTEQGALLKALGYYERAAATNPQREDLARSIMHLYDELGQPNTALQVYQKLEKELQDSLDVTPSPQTIELAKKIKNSH